MQSAAEQTHFGWGESLTFSDTQRSLAMRLATSIVGFLTAATLLSSGNAFGQLRAFPEAEGFGANATGGRGGSVYHVTHLGDSGAGSFRDAVSSGNRTVVFDVGGWIELASPVSVKDNITIAGQTAPGDGIGLKNFGLSFSNADNVIARHLRVRQGPYVDSIGRDAVGATGASNVIFDHISAVVGPRRELQHHEQQQHHDPEFDRCRGFAQSFDGRADRMERRHQHSPQPVRQQQRPQSEDQGDPRFHQQRGLQLGCVCLRRGRLGRPELRQCGQQLLHRGSQ